MLEKLVFGTAALGLPYGLGRPGAPASMLDEADAHGLVAAAVESRITTFDTAPAYGIAEERLGRALGARGVVWTKLGRQEVVGSELTSQALDSVARSVSRLERPRLELLQWHNWTASLGLDQHFRACWSALGQDPRVAALGASTYGATDALAAVESGLFRLVQVEWSLLNQSVVSAVSARAKALGVKLAVRSVFLQGALTDDARVLPEIDTLRRAVASARSLARELGIGLQHLALRAALDHDGIDHVLVGVDRPEQIADAVRIAGASPLPASAERPVRSLSLGGDPSADPRTWGTARSVVPPDADPPRP